MPQANPYETLHAKLMETHQRVCELLTAKSECLEGVQQSKHPLAHLPKILEALQSQHEWELEMTNALEHIIEVVGVAVDEVEDINLEPVADGTQA